MEGIFLISYCAVNKHIHDHSKNWAFLQTDNGKWKLASFYEITFSPSPYNEDATAFSGYGKQPSLQVIQKPAMQKNFSF